MPTSPHSNHNTRFNHNPRTLPPSNNPGSSDSSPGFDFAITKMSRAEGRKSLGARSNFTKREVVLRHSTLARKHHPDKWNSSAPQSKEVSAENSR